MSYEKDKLDSYVTSASLSTALAPYITSNSSSAAIAAAIAGVNLAPYMTSNSISAAVTTDALTVRGAASISATLSAAAVTIAARPVSSVVLGYQAISNATALSFSGSWSDYAMLECRITYRASGTSTASLAVFTDGGTTPMMGISLNYPIAATGGYGIEWLTWGANGTGTPNIAFTIYSSGTGNFSGYTATANSGFANCIKYSTSKTMSSGMAILIGYRSS